VKSACLYKEKWRWGRKFRTNDVVKLRGHTSEDVVLLDGSDVRDRFPELPESIHNANWKVLSCDKWNRVESQAVLEGRAIAWSVKHLARGINNHGKRHLIITDATAALFAISKGRSSSWGMLRVCRNVAAHLLATRMNIFYVGLHPS
jgi:hypothetical protein